jgi:hypothetical protein
MAKTKADGRVSPARFKTGDLVSFLFGSGTVTGRVVEDRGNLGIGGRRLYGIRFEINPGQEVYTEMPEEELAGHPATRTGGP